jgi:alpha-beta hydrolase superfamily lysophospholipase
MYKAQLLEFKNKKGNLIRGVFIGPKKFIKCVIFIHGFEGTSSTDKKFKVISEKLAEKNIASLRLDSEGCGLSGGDFKNMTVKNQAEELSLVIKKINCKNISIVTHSLGACIVTEYLKNNENIFGNIILFSPALNQRDLLRYWFVKSSNKNNGILWKNYKNYLNEKDFQKNYKKKSLLTKENYFPYNYFKENQNKDYSEKFNINENVLYIIGDKDDVTPTESVTIKFKNKIIVKGGDHDLRRPDMEKQYLNKVIKFINDRCASVIRK